jgi:hypothetical protein
MSRVADTPNFVDVRAVMVKSYGPSRADFFAEWCVP